MKTFSFESLKKLTFFKLKDAKTCAHCLRLFSSSERRENHERNIHEDVDVFSIIAILLDLYISEESSQIGDDLVHTSGTAS